jgi:acyl CoA:acetate/3-ketoacid CoA transferase beta subunit
LSGPAPDPLVQAPGIGVRADWSAQWPQSGRVVLCGEGPYEPSTALAGYLEARPPSGDSPVHIVFGMRRNAPPMLADRQPGLSVGSFLPGRGLSAIHALAYHRASYIEICNALKSGTIRFDAVIACAAPLGHPADSVYSLGGVAGYMGLAISSATEIFVERVAWLPHVAGAICVSSPAAIFSTSASPTERQAGLARPFDENDLKIAAHALSCFPASPTLAIGIGRIPDALSTLLCERRDITLLTGVIQESARAMSAAGALGGRPVRAMSIVGDQQLLEWAAATRTVRLEPSTSVHNPHYLASQPNMVCVLGALQVDRRGNVNSETVNGRLVSGLGGAPDFARGAHRSPGGRCIIAMRSTGPSGSTLLADRVDNVSIPGADVDVVVTELGVADLRGRSGQERQHALERIF